MEVDKNNDEFYDTFFDPRILNISKNFSKILDALFEKHPSKNANKFMSKILKNTPLDFTKEEYDLIVINLQTYIILEKKFHLKVKGFDSTINNPNIAISLASSKHTSEITKKINLAAQTAICVGIIKASSETICIDISKKIIELLKESNHD